MVTEYMKARDVVRSRLAAVFDPDTFSALYPETEKAPKVYLGFPVTEPHFYAAVDEIIDTASTSGAATMGHDEVSFTINVWLHAQHSSLETASNALMCYVDAVFGSVMADPQLNFTVDNSFPRIESAGTAADSSNRYIAAAAVGINCTVHSACPAELYDVVRADNDRIKEETGEGDSY